MKTNTADSTMPVEVHGMTRSAFILKGALATGSLYGVGAISPYVAGALAQSGSKGDIDILNFALTLEYLETDFYMTSVKAAKLGGDTKKLATDFQGDEQAHVDALTKTIQDLGGKPEKKPTFGFPVTDEKSFLKLAVTLEDTGVGAYNGAAPSIKSKDVLAAAGSIVQIEARHAAAIRMAAGEDPSPEAFDKAMQKAAVETAVKPFIKS